MQGRGTEPQWRALREAAIAYADTPTDEGADRLFVTRRRELARAAVRWGLALPPECPVALVARLDGRWWRRVVRSALIVAAAVEEEGTRRVAQSVRVRVAYHRLRQDVAHWIRFSARVDLGIRGALRAAEVAA